MGKKMTRAESEALSARTQADAAHLRALAEKAQAELDRRAQSDVSRGEK
jgi:hypothetical protein